MLTDLIPKRNWKQYVQKEYKPGDIVLMDPLRGPVLLLLLKHLPDKVNDPFRKQRWLNLIVASEYDFGKEPGIGTTWKCVLDNSSFFSRPDEERELINVRSILIPSHKIPPK